MSKRGQVIRMLCFVISNYDLKTFNECFYFKHVACSQIEK